MQQLLFMLYVVFISILVLFVPGFSLSWIFFDKGQIKILERILLSVGLSLAIIPIIVFYASLMGVKINPVSVSIEISVIIIFSVGIYFARKHYKKRKK